MKRGTLWLHVGTHKTGTTSIQRALRLHEVMFRQAGVALHPHENAWQLADLFIRAELWTTARLKSGHPRPTMADFSKASKVLDAARGDCRDMIISSEEFCMLREGLEAFALSSMLGARFDRIVLLLALRNEADWRASREDQLRKTGVWDEQKALPDAQSNDGEWYYDRAAILRFWQQIGQVIAIDFDEARKTEGSILPAFGRAIGFPEAFSGLDLNLNVRSKTA